MGSIAIFNIGNRDVQIKEEFTLPLNHLMNKGIIDSRLSREIGEEIFKYYKLLEKEKKQDDVVTLLQNNLEYPIIEKVLEDISRNNISCIYLIASDQQCKHNKDTIFFAKIIQRYLNRIKGRKECNIKLDNQCKIRLLCVKENPADIDYMNQYFKDKLRWISTKHKDIDKAYICISGGTQAMNSMMLINAVDIFKHRLEVLYVLPQSSKPVYLRVGKEILKNIVKERLKATVSSLDFKAAATLVEDHKELFDDIRKLNTIYKALKYAHARISFDFISADEEIRYCITNSSGTAREFFCKLQDDIQFDSGHKDLEYFLELKDNAKYHACRGEYIDFLGRIFRMQEAAYYLLADAKGVERSDGGARLKKSWISENPNLEQYLKEYKTLNGEPLKLYRKLNRVILEAILSYYEMKDDKLKDIMKDLRSIDNLAELRNKSPLAHGYKGASKVIIEKEYNDSFENLLCKLNKISEGICKYMSKSVNNVPFYEDLVKKLLEMIEDCN